MVAKVLSLILLALFIVPVGLYNIQMFKESALSLYQFSRMGALWGTVLLGLEFVLIARFKFIERHFGQDKLSGWHHFLGIASFGLLLFHGVYFVMIYSMAAWEIWGIRFGVLALILLTGVMVAIFIYRLAVYKFEVWRLIHLSNYVVFPLAYIHAILSGSAVPNNRLLQAEWVILGIAFVASAVYRIVITIQTRNTPYQISSVHQETHDIWSIGLKGKPIQFKPGQYLYLQLIHNGKISPAHPFTISSSPMEPEIRLSIKAIGDFTNQTTRLKPGDSAFVDGPYGRFSYFNYGGQEEGLIFIAGGIGITPFLSMLHYLSVSQTHREVWLIWGNKSQKDIPFKDEFERIKKDLNRLKILHVLSDEQLPNYANGFIDTVKVKTFVGSLDEKEIFICGPAVMTDKIIKELRQIKIPEKKIHSERFMMG